MLFRGNMADSIKKLRWLLYPLFVFMLSRALIFGVGYLADTMLPTEEGHWIADENNSFISMWSKWDSQYYLDIAKNGYWYRPGQQSNVAFFPLYPMLMRLVSPLTGANMLMAGIILSNLAFLGALIFLYLLAELETDAESAGNAIFYIAVFPSSFFLNSVYTESLFLLLTVAAIYYARRQKWFFSALLGLLAASTRNLGIVTWALVMWEWLRVQGWSMIAVHKRETWLNLLKGFRKNWLEVLIIGIIPMGMIVFVFFLKINFERPFAFIETQSAWGRENIGPVAVVIKNFDLLLKGNVNKSWMSVLWNMIAFLSFLTLVPFIWKKLGEGYALYTLVLLLIPTASALGSIIRYVLVLYPAFICLGAIGKSRPALNRILTAVLTILLGVFVTLFVNWIFVA